MIVDDLTKVLMPANHKVFIEMISLEDQEKRLTSIKLEKDQRNIFLLCKIERNRKVLDTQLIYLDTFGDGQIEPY